MVKGRISSGRKTSLLMELASLAKEIDENIKVVPDRRHFAKLCFQNTGESICIPASRNWITFFQILKELKQDKNPQAQAQADESIDKSTIIQILKNKGLQIIIIRNNAKTSKKTLQISYKGRQAKLTSLSLLQIEFILGYVYRLLSSNPEL